MISCLIWPLYKRSAGIWRLVAIFSGVEPVRSIRGLMGVVLLSYLAPAEWEIGTLQQSQKHTVIDGHSLCLEYGLALMHQG